MSHLHPGRKTPFALGRSRRRSAAVGTIALLAVAGLTACASGSGDTGSTSSLTFGLASEGHVPVAVAVERDMFADAGLDVTIQTLSGGNLSASAAFESGAVDITQTGAPGFIQDVANGAITDSKVFGQLSDGSYEVVTGPGITSIAQLRGQPLGISGVNGQDQIVFDAILQRYDMSGDDVTWITTGSPANRLTALSTGAVKAVVMPQELHEQSVKAGTILDVDIDLTIPNFLYAAKTSYIDANRATLEKFLDVMGQAAVWTRENPDEAADMCASYWKQDRAVCASNITSGIARADEAGSFTWQEDQAVNMTGMQTAYDALSSFLPQVKDVEVADLVDTSFTTSGGR